MILPVDWFIRYFVSSCHILTTLSFRWPSTRLSVSFEALLTYTDYSFNSRTSAIWIMSLLVRQLQDFLSLNRRWSYRYIPNRNEPISNIKIMRRPYSSNLRVTRASAYLVITSTISFVAWDSRLIHFLCDRSNLFFNWPVIRIYSLHSQICLASRCSLRRSWRSCLNLFAKSFFHATLPIILDCYLNLRWSVFN